MANLTVGRMTQRQGDHTLNEQPDWPVAAGKKLFDGCMAALDAGGNLVDAGDGTAAQVIGVVDGSVDNTGGAAGAKRGLVRRGAFWFDNSATTPVVAASAYVTTLKAEDNHTVTLTGGTGPAIRGRCLRLSWGGEAAGVLVEFF
jgi:hypothetical protein